KVEAGEPVHSVNTQSSGAATDNYYVLAAADTPVHATHRFGGVSIEISEIVAAGTTTAQYLNCACPAPDMGLIRGMAKDTSAIDTQAALNLIIQDYTLIDYNSTGGADGGELYTIIETATSDTSCLEILRGNPALGTLDVVVHARGYRHDVT
ncbi:unnamed protein product, partial [marine sediment metagenome]